MARFLAIVRDQVSLFCFCPAAQGDTHPCRWPRPCHTRPSRSGSLSTSRRRAPVQQHGELGASFHVCLCAVADVSGPRQPVDQADTRAVTPALHRPRRDEPTSRARRHACSPVLNLFHGGGIHVANGVHKSLWPVPRPPMAPVHVRGAAVIDCRRLYAQVRHDHPASPVAIPCMYHIPSFLSSFYQRLRYD